ncbi:hypothetical protein GWR56_06485 [Mucilaginibacter sp. 14171R-50]|uniref:hypothetical protein n=1 Tax=Mucilaginibacter sp. 14171R-50 TaxID=2703789 RepID=UPI00138C5FD3|nr:hypothetical protein [Mucilaginibacter sp. 14171R-50]QHS55203.1 hypothetical protein GWR56_06485 [Mucilaginibacter sp. 14171R-50]
MNGPDRKGSLAIFRSNLLMESGGKAYHCGKRRPPFRLQLPDEAPKGLWSAFSVPMAISSSILIWFLQFVNDLKALDLSISGEGANDYRNVYRQLKITLVPGGKGTF